MSPPSSAAGAGEGGTFADAAGSSAGAAGPPTDAADPPTKAVGPSSDAAGSPADVAGSYSDAAGSPVSRRGTWVFVGTAIAILALDQLTKYIVRLRLPIGSSWPNSDALTGRFFSFTHVENTGVSFGMFQGHNDVMVIVALVVVAGVLLYRRHVARKDTWLNVATGLIVGGALGNMVDRVAIDHVVDFLDFKVWPVFNVADTSVFVGVLLLTVHIWLEEHEQQKSQRAEAEAAAAAAATAATLAEATEESGD